MNAIYLVIIVYVFGVLAFLRQARKVGGNRKYWIISMAVILTWPISMFGLLFYGFKKQRETKGDE